MKLKTMLAVVATAAAVPLSGWAGEPTGPQGTFLDTPYPYTYPAFVTMDRNGDGIITRDEYAAATGTLPPPAPVVAAPVIAAPVVTAPVLAAPIAAPPAAVVYQPAPVAYAPVVVQPAVPVPHYSWHSADSNPPAPAQ